MTGANGIRSAAIAGVVGASLALAACDDQTGSSPIRPVLSVVARTSTTQTIGPFAGSIEPRYTVVLGFQVFGRLISRDVNVGDSVTKGETLATIDPAVQEIAVRSAQASLDSAQAQLTTVQATEERQRTLLEQRVIAQAQFDLTEQNRAAAAANVTQAKDRLAKAQDELGYTQLRSPIDGVDGAPRRGRADGDRRSSHRHRRPPRRAGGGVRHSRCARLRPAPGRGLHGRLGAQSLVQRRRPVREIAPEADPTTRTRRVRLTLDNPPDVFLLGTTVLVSRTADTAPRIDLPITALVEHDGKAMVWVVDPRTLQVALREVKLAGRDATMISVSSGLAAGDRVVVAGVHSLSPGQAVKILEASQ
jgi:membrane fusion protein, multidrug efflux system